jgi:serine/threonine-protein kinase
MALARPGGAPEAICYPGMLLDRYELLCPLAQGGMGAVWLARYSGKFGFSRLVVVKVMLPQFARDEQMRTMFIDEARIAAEITHPNVVATIDVGEQDGVLFLVMEWVDGDSLSRLVKQVSANHERVPAGVVLKIASDVCSGLHAAHEQRDSEGELRGVVHRDVSPQNVLLATNGRAMLIDFGIAKANKRISEATAFGRVKGKLSYMSPEQARTQAVDRRADVFAVGAVLYELFAGIPPFERENDVQTIVRLTRGGPAPPLPRETPQAVQSIVMRAVALDANERFQTAAELGDAIVHAMHQIGAPTTDHEVARYTDDYLSVRREQRQRAVQAALFSTDGTAMARMASAAGSDAPGGRAVTLEFDASPFASAIGASGEVQLAQAMPQPIASDVMGGMLGATGGNDLLLSPPPERAFSAVAWPARTLLERHKKHLSVVLMASILISSMLISALVVVKLREPDARQTTQAIPTMALQPQSMMVPGAMQQQGPVVVPYQGQVPLQPIQPMQPAQPVQPVQPAPQPTVYSNPNVLPTGTPTATAPAGPTATTTSFTIPNPQPIRKPHPSPKPKSPSQAGSNDQADFGF